MTAAAASPAPTARKKPARSLFYNPLAGALYITVGKDEFGYWVDRLPSGYRLTRFKDAVRAGEEESYDVQAGEAGTTCTCKGFARWSHCKHASGVAKLLELGRLS